MNDKVEQLNTTEIRIRPYKEIKNKKYYLSTNIEI